MQQEKGTILVFTERRYKTWAFGNQAEASFRVSFAGKAEIELFIDCILR